MDTGSDAKENACDSGNEVNQRKGRVVLVARENLGVKGSVLHVGKPHTYVPPTETALSIKAMPSKSPPSIRVDS